MYCKNCRTKGSFGELFIKTGKQRHHAYEWKCTDCGHTFYWG